MALANSNIWLTSMIKHQIRLGMFLRDIGHGQKSSFYIWKSTISNLGGGGGQRLHLIFSPGWLVKCIFAKEASQFLFLQGGISTKTPGGWNSLFFPYHSHSKRVVELLLLTENNLYLFSGEGDFRFFRNGKGLYLEKGLQFFILYFL